MLIIKDIEDEVQYYNSSDKYLVEIKENAIEIGEKSPHDYSRIRLLMLEISKNKDLTVNNRLLLNGFLEFEYETE
jgi:hypothetical protein